MSHGVAARIGPNGRVTIPKGVRTALGIAGGDERAAHCRLGRRHPEHSSNAGSRARLSAFIGTGSRHLHYHRCSSPRSLLTDLRTTLA